MKRTKLFIWTIIISLFICSVPVLAEGEKTDAKNQTQTEQNQTESKQDKTQTEQPKVSEGEEAPEESAPQPVVETPKPKFDVNINFMGTTTLTYTDYIEKTMYDQYTQLGMKIEDQFIQMLGDEKNVTVKKTENKAGYYEIAATRTYNSNEDSFMLPKTIPGSAILKEKGIFGTKYILNEYYPSQSQGSEEIMFEINVKTPMPISFCKGQSEKSFTSAKFVFKSGIENFAQLTVFVPSILGIILIVLIIAVIVFLILFFTVIKKKRNLKKLEEETEPEYDEDGNVILPEDVEEAIEDDDEPTNKTVNEFVEEVITDEEETDEEETDEEE